MSKVLIIVQRYFPAQGGAESDMQRLAERLVLAGHEVDVWTSDAHEPDALWYPKRKKVEGEYDNINGVNVRRFKTSPFFLNNLFFNKGFRYVMWHMPSWHLQCLGSPPTCIGMYLQLLKGKYSFPKYDIIHVSSMPYNSIFYVGMYLAKKLGARLYITPAAHSNVTGKYVLEDKYFHPRVLPFYASADKVFVHTNEERQSLLNFFERYKGITQPHQVVKYGYDAFKMGGGREEVKISNSTPTALFLLAKIFITIVSIPVFLTHFISSLIRKKTSIPIDDSKLVTIPLGVEPKEIMVGNGKRFREKYGIPKDQPIVFYVGAREGVKGVYNLVNASEILWKRGFDFKLVMGGNNSIAFEEFWGTKDEFVKERTIVLNRPSDEEKWDLFDAGDIFVMVSKSESFGLVYLEAWLYKKPVIGCDIPIIREVITEGRDGFVVPFDDSEKLAERIEYLLKNGDVAKRLGESGYERVMRSNTWDGVFKEHSRYY